MRTTRDQAIRNLRTEAQKLRAWADANLPERNRVELYLMASRLEQTARALADEPVWQRVGADVSESTRSILAHAQRGLKRAKN